MGLSPHSRCYFKYYDCKLSQGSQRTTGGMCYTMAQCNSNFGSIYHEVNVIKRSYNWTTQLSISTTRSSSSSSDSRVKWRKRDGYPQSLVLSNHKTLADWQLIELSLWHLFLGGRRIILNINETPLHNFWTHPTSTWTMYKMHTQMHTLLFKDELAILGLCGLAVTQSVNCSVKVYYIRPLRRLVLHMRRG